MGDIDDVLERVVTDPEFRAQLAKDPAAALRGYELSAADLELLAASLSGGEGDLPRGVEQRTSKSAVLGLLASFAPAGGAAAEGIPNARVAGDAAPASSGGAELEEVGIVFQPVRSPEGAGDLTSPAEGGAEDPRADVAAGESTDARVSNVEALTIKQTAVDDSSRFAPPGSDDLAPRQQSAPPAEDFLTIEDA